jgi:hypothetical protein
LAITKAQLRTLVGRELQILPSNRTALNDTDAALVDEHIDGTTAWLIEEGDCYWSANAIPEAVKLPFSWMIAASAASAFDKQYAKGDAGYMLLKQHTSLRSSGEPTKAVYY